MNAQVQFGAKGAVITHSGKVRGRANEDCCVFGGIFVWGGLLEPINAICTPTAPWIIAVADGIGGQNAGEQASREVIFRLASCQDYNERLLIDVLCELNEKLFRLGQTNAACAGMGATVAGIACGLEGVFAFNVGDARVYREQDGYLQQITRDDSVAQLLAEAGQAETDQVRSGSTHQLTQAVGGRSELITPIEPHIESLSLNRTRRFMLCTDGLTDMVAIDQMEKIVAGSGNVVAAVSELFRAAMEAGGEDNTTIVVADISPTSPRDGSEL